MEEASRARTARAKESAKTSGNSPSPAQAGAQAGSQRAVRPTGGPGTGAGAGGVGRQSKLVGPVLRATRRHRGLPTEKCHDRVLHVSGLCSTVREPGEAGRRGTR